MTMGKIFLIVGNNRSYCFIKSPDLNGLVFAHRNQFADKEMMIVGANVQFELEATKKAGRFQAARVEAA